MIRIRARLAGQERWCPSTWHTEHYFKGAAYSGGSFALHFLPSGAAPNYVLMPLVHCLYGEGADRLALRNLADFVIHVTGRPN